MSNFMDLSCPERTSAPTDKWYVTSIDSLYALSHDGEMENISNLPSFKTVYFDDEVAAHAAAGKYYIDQNKMYPYNSDWLRALRFTIGTAGESVESVSQIMEFI